MVRGKRFNVRAHLPLVRESERVLARTKKERMKLPYWSVREEELNVWWRVARLPKGTGNATIKGNNICLRNLLLREEHLNG